MSVFHDYTYGQAVALMEHVAKSRPDLVSLTTAQSRFGLGTAGTCTGSDGSRGPCLNHIVTITNKSSHASQPLRAAVYISGALHGDERVGIMTALELCRWIVSRYDSDPWMKRLVDKRVIVLTPMTNAVGAATRTRSELSIDPNRDFPFDQSPSACMQTIAARTVNEIYRSHILQMVVTFHGGMQAIGYEWGAFPYLNGKPHRSPDDNSMRQISAAFSRFAGTGAVSGNRLYPAATMNDLVYPVHGGMEDWGYGASWDKDKVKPCTPRANGGYSASKTKYGSADARAFTVLVETSDYKAPSDSTLGGDKGVYNPGLRDRGGDGHVPRNMRLALAAIDLVEPYVVAWTSGGKGGDKGCIPMYWQVWGAVSVDESYALWRPTFYPTSWRSASWLATNKGGGQLAESAPLLGGSGVWGGSSTGLSPAQLSGCIKVPSGAKGKIELAVRVRVDSSWGGKPSIRFAPEQPPQTHIANVRANAKYDVEQHGKHLKGQLHWVSHAVAVTLDGSRL